MAKLPTKYQFLDLSDYGRNGGLWIASRLKNTRFTPIHVTTLFIFSGFVAIWCMLNGCQFEAPCALVRESGSFPNYKRRVRQRF